MDLSQKVRAIKDFPKDGIIFRDITTLLQDAESFGQAIEKIQDSIKDLDFDIVIGPESRGFIFGTPIAYNLKRGFVPVRKEGKLPWEVNSMSYDLEYGQATIEIHKDALTPGQKVVIIDDLLATGGTAKAIVDLVKSMGAEVSALCFLIELDGLGGRDVLKDQNVYSVIKFKEE